MNAPAHHPSVVEDCAAHVHRGRPLPASAYTDQDFFEAEARHLFAGSWTCIGFEDDVPAPGDVLPVACAGSGLILARGHDGAVRVLRNYCRHRGMRLVEARASGLKRLVCPYHCWAYGLDGRIQRTPHIGGFGKHDAAQAGVDLPEGLIEVRSAIWSRLVFIDLSGRAGPFEDHIAPLAGRWRDHDFTTLRPGAEATYEVACNWKLAVENFVDIYHIPYVHPGLNAYSDLGDHYIVEGERLFGQGNADVVPTDDAVGRLPRFSGLPQAREKTLEALCLFPNLLVTVTCDYLRVIQVEPLAPGRCREHVRIFVVGEAALAPALADARQTLLTRFAAFNDEDVDLVQRLQAGMEASGFADGRFAPAYDGSVMAFQKALMTAIAGTPAE